MKTSLFAVILLAALAVPAAADRAEDDLQVVKKALGSSSPVAQARPPAEEPPAEAKPAPRRAEPRWFRVRITEKGGKHGRVSINLPIGIARALDSGQSLVEIDDEEASVRMWID